MGGKSSADASTTTIDQRAVTESGFSLTSSGKSRMNLNQTDSGVVVATGGKSNVTVQTSDMGAINGAFGFAREVARDAFDLTAASQVDVTRSITDAMHGVQEAYADAYAGAKQGDQKVLVAVGLGVVAMVAVSAFKGK